MDYYWSVIDFNNNEKLPTGLVQPHNKPGPILSDSNISSFHRVLTTTVEFEEPDKTIDTMLSRLCILDSPNVIEDRYINESEIVQQYYNTVQVIIRRDNTRAAPVEGQAPPLTRQQGISLAQARKPVR